MKTWSSRYIPAVMSIIELVTAAALIIAWYPPEYSAFQWILWLLFTYYTWNGLTSFWLAAFGSDERVRLAVGGDIELLPWRRAATDQRRVKFPSTRTTLIILAAVLIVGFLAIGEYAPRLGFFWNAMHRNVMLGEWSFPFRLLAAACVIAGAARLLIADRRPDPG